MKMSLNPTPTKHQPDSPLLANRVVTIAASAGGIRALREVMSALPGDLKACVLIVQHLDPHHISMISEILNKHSHLMIKQAREGDLLLEGKVYIAPPNWHLLIKEDHALGLSQSEQVLFLRPSANLLFASAAQYFQDKVVAVVLTGTGRDGADGVVAVKAAGGWVIAQDEDTSEFFGMPHAAILTGGVDYILPLEEIAAKIVSLTSGE